MNVKSKVTLVLVGFVVILAWVFPAAAQDNL